MENLLDFGYIRNKIRKYKKADLFRYSINYLKKADLNSERVMLWNVLTLMKWTYLYAEERPPFKSLTPNDFAKLVNMIQKLQENSVQHHIDENNWGTFFQIVSYQQFYLQLELVKDDFARSICIYDRLSHKYDINKSFAEKTGLSIFEFVQMSFVYWMFMQPKLHGSNNFYNGYINDGDRQAFTAIFDSSKIDSFLNLLTISNTDANDKIGSYGKSLRSGSLQPFEISVFTMYPLQLIFGKLNIVHSALFNHTCLYYIYDYLKENDESFTTEFGNRFEQYVELGLKEIDADYQSENSLQSKLGKGERVIDFLVEDYLLIECKGIEQKPIAAVNPFNEVAYRALKDSLIKAYCKQMLNVISKLNLNEDCFGLIVTYKDFYYSSLDDLNTLIIEEFKNLEHDYKAKTSILSPSKVFVIDIRTWEEIIQIVKTKGVTFRKVLNDAYEANKQPETMCKSFHQHLDKYELIQLELSYLKDSYNEIEVLFSK